MKKKENRDELNPKESGTLKINNLSDESKTTGQGSSEPNVAEHVASEPEAPEQEAAEQGSSEAEVSEQKAAEHVASETEAPEQEAAEHVASEPEANEPKTYDSQSAEKKAYAGAEKENPTLNADSQAESDSGMLSKRRKRINILLSLILSTILWAVVITDENPTITTTCTNVEISYVNTEDLEDSGLVLSEDSDKFIEKITIKGNRNDIIKLNKRNITAEVDVSSFEEGKNHANANISLPSGITLESSASLKITANVEKIVEKDIEIKTKFYGDIDDGKEAVQISSDPETVTVRGAKSLVNSVNYVKAVVNSAGVGDTPTEIRAKLTPVDDDGENVDDVSLSEKTAVINTQLYVKKNVPLKVVTTGKPDLSVKLASAEAGNIMVLCDPDISEDITEVETEPLDISGLKEYERTKVTPVLPQGVKLSSTQAAVTAEIFFEKREEKTITVNTSDIICSNLKSNEAVVFKDSTVDVELYSDTAIPDEAEGAIRLTIDCSELSANQEEIPVAISWKSGTFMETTIDAGKVTVKANLIYLQ